MTTKKAKAKKRTYLSVPILLSLDQEFPPDSLEDFASDDDASPIDHLVRLHKMSIKKNESLLKREKELLVRFLGSDVGESEYVEAVEGIGRERSEGGSEIMGVVDEIRRN
jgi:hypothetical protein